MTESKQQIDALLDAAEQDHRLGNLDQAVARYHSVLELDENNADAHYGIGTVNLQQKNFGEAAQAFEVAIGQAPHDPEFFCQLWNGTRSFRSGAGSGAGLPFCH